MKSYEKEAFKKSFILFFIVQIIFLSLLTYKTYNDNIHHLGSEISSSLMQCYLSKKCDRYKMLHLDYTKKLQHHLYVENNQIFMIFKTNSGIKKMQFSSDEYTLSVKKIQNDILFYFVLYMIILIVISLLFALYTSTPLRKAFKLNDNFIKDILHDINTPLSALRINLTILTKQFGNNTAINRSQESIKNILSLQDNMNHYLNNSNLNKDKVNLNHLIEKKIISFSNLYNNIKFIFKNENTIYLSINKNAINRILDNIISNACKYNKTNGSVLISFKNNILKIKDTGQGIKNTTKIFDRYYKENDSGIGIGLDVVNKLCKNCNITIDVNSVLTKGSTFKLDCSEVILK
ncbi:Two-component system histidine kinase DccS [hydrothermal vent metagenome]|uniref:histidine kinase n=1 Tax=hydrothermal vent metagenome TaxID=652676 RepID=A0A3B1EAC0_9ZZZZ